MTAIDYETTYETIRVERRAPIYLITLNRRDRMNGFIPQIAVDLCRATEIARDDPEVRVLILTGADPAFSAGADLKVARELGSMAPVETRELVRGYQRAIFGLVTFPKPTIGAVNGVAAGGGSHLLMSCDVRIGSERARFGEAFIKIGLVPDLGGGYLLPRLIGLATARELVLTSRVIDAREAEDLGLLNRVVPHDALMDAAREMALQMAAMPADSLAAAKRLMYRRILPGLRRECEAEAVSQAICRSSEDNREAVEAFVTKRKPVFRGR